MVAVSVSIIAFGWWLPLADVLTYPTRISVLPSLQVDAPTYDELGAAIATSGRWTDVPPMQPPGFVVILAVVYRVFGHSLLAAKVLLWLCMVAATLLAGWLTKRVWGTTPAWVAMALTATAPTLRHYVGTLQYEVVAGTGLLAVLGLALKAAEGSTRRALVWALAAGLAGGALTLIREVFIGVVPIIGLWMAASAWSSAGARRATALLILFALVFAAPVVWWSALQSSKYGRIIVMTDKGTATLALGNNPRTSGTYNVDVIEQPAGLRFVVERPADAMNLAIRKVMFFWGLRRGDTSGAVSAHGSWRLAPHRLSWFGRVAGSRQGNAAMVGAPCMRCGWLRRTRHNLVVSSLRRAIPAGGLRGHRRAGRSNRGSWLALDDLSPDEARRGYRSGVSGHCGSVERQPV